MSAILQVNNLEKSFAGSFTLGPVATELSAGDSLAVFGKNGAGKTTLFQLLTGSLDATSGSVSFLGKKMLPEAFELKRRIGYLPQDLGLPRWLSGAELLSYAARLHRIRNQSTAVKDALEYWDCTNFRKRPLAACSHGMQKRVGLALATMHSPDLLILDEPFSGLDLFHIHALNQVLEKRTSQSMTTIISTHIAPYAAQRCNKAMILDDGKMITLSQWDHSDESARTEMIESYFFGSKNRGTD